jgi:hypothetical protein
VNLRLLRTKFLPETTLGELYVNDEFECYTCEDVYRDLEVEAKVPGRTAIPEGVYSVVITMSQRFRVRMPLLLDVPHFAGIRIHTGNTHLNTEGCILVGRQLLPAGVGQSRLAYEALFAKLEDALNAAELVRIEVTNVQAKA